MGNGYLSHAKGVRSDTIFISGVFNGETTSPSHRARIPANLAVTINNTITTGVLLDIETGVYYRRGTFSSSSTGSSYELRWYAHRTSRNLYIMELTVNVGGEEESISFSLTNNSGEESSDFTFGGSSCSVNTDGFNSCYRCGSTKIPETTAGTSTSVCYMSDMIPSTMTVSKANSGKTTTFISAYRTSLDSTDALNDVIADFGTAKSTPSKLLMHSHMSGWQELWSTGIEIDGRPDVAVAVNASMYAILSSIRDDWPYGLAPGGLTNYYNGHSFWDTETWMYPPLLFTHPSVAKELLQYRYDRLDGAKQKAASYTPPFAGTM
jgi:trehalose/maltose hydrolase-like predicted phosphorylase